VVKEKQNGKQYRPTALYLGLVLEVYCLSLDLGGYCVSLDLEPCCLGLVLGLDT